MRAARGRCDGGAAGFTLLELLVALALSAMLMALLAQAIAGLRVRSVAASQDAAAAAHRQSGKRALALLLAGALPSATPGGAATFVGDARSAAFLAVPPQSLATRGTLRVRLLVEPVSASQVGVYLETTPETPSLAGAAGVGRRLLLSGLTSASFEYAARADADMRPEWQAGGHLPALVRLRLQWQGTDAVRVEDLVVAIRRQQTGGCPLDPISMSCRVPHGG